MADKVHRRWALEVGRPGTNGVRYEGMRLTFDVELRADSRATAANVSVYMPDRALRGLVEAPDSVTRVLAGYRDGGAVEIVRGETVTDSVQETRQGPDRVLSWSVSGARVALLQTVPSRSWSSVRASEVIEWIRQQCGIPADVIRLGSDFTIARGYVVEGSPKQELTDLCASTGSRWQIVDGRLRILPVGEASRPVRAALWSSSTGLRPSPQQRQDGRVVASALLEPGLRPGDIVRIVDDAYAGDVLIDRIRHEGDSHDTPWYSTVEGVPA